MGAERTPTGLSRRPDRAGFTLTEALLVVAIIALLISILLPSLYKARALARATACMSNLANIGQGENMYRTENQEWIPGSPWTTGLFFMESPAGVWNPQINGFNRFVVEWMDYTTPLQALMYGPGSVPRPAGPSNTDAHQARIAIFKKLTEELFHCPSNPHIMSWAHGNDPGPNVRAVSYMTMWTLMRAGPGRLNEVLKDKDNGYQRFPGLIAVSPDPEEPLADKAPFYVAQSDQWDVVPPADYVPRHTQLGREQMKVFAADGARYYDEDSDTITYTTALRAAKGMVCATPPSTAENANEPGGEGREYNAGRHFSYRHGNHDRINAGFFDGHVESLGVDYKTAAQDGSHFKGRAVHPQWYYPTGSVVKHPQGLHANTIPAGTTLP